MKILIWSDIHLHNWPYGSKLVDGVNSRLLAGREVMHQIAEYIQRNEVDHIVFCGDLFHTHGNLNEQVLKVAYEGITEIMHEVGGPRMDMLVGNHDTSTKDLSTHSLHWLNSIPGVRVIDKPTHNDDTVSIGKREFSFLPYTEDEEVLKKFLAEANSLCFMHQGMVDVPMASGFVINEIMNHDMIPDHVRHVFTGHYHPLHMLPKATTVGSVMQHTWADQGDTRGFLVYDTDTHLMKQVNTHAPEFRALNMGGAGSLGPHTRSGSGWDRRTLKGNYIRVFSFAENGMENLRKEILAEGAASVEFVIKPNTYKKTVVKALSGKGLSVPELVREYEDEHSVSVERRNVGKELMNGS